MKTLAADLEQLRLAALTWGPVDDRDRPLAVLLHGFPDTAHTWRHLGPALAGAGFRVVAPFTRGYAPSGLPADGSYHVPALMRDVLELHAALGGDGRSVVVGHDWGAITANGLAALPDGPFARVVSMAVPPVPALRPAAADVSRWARILPRQAALSWYVAFNQLPALPERSFERLAAHLWRRWSPAYDATADLEHLAAALPTRERRAAAIGYYRAQARPWQLPSRYRDLARVWLAEPRVPLLYLQGSDDGCLAPAWTARLSALSARLPAGSRAAVVADAGHFLQLERPDVVADRVLEFLAEGNLP
ncbi:alpha/beta hydrolase [Nocardioides sp. TF02-7]|uniref:alpha/beta fold hydrolase n=1 Tax=Nocardioides sp. TF02-7 TaxID=2917724 RepID=UPI001F057390|nr:alpha/beta hydrolase [Nocardioides sp. TF02-7]UMG93637.1 alpha/beta hydrolase [Nocardioides sp. TF02-7]